MLCEDCQNTANYSRMYLVRTAIASYYTYRIDSVTSRLEEQQTQRAKTIDKLKAATKYNSTQQLLEKYGGAPPQAPKPKAKGQSPARIPKKVPSSDAPVRTSMGPPATANIQRNHEPPSQPSTPQPMPMRQDIPQIGTPAMHRPLMRQPSQAEFAPNAFLSTPQYDQGDINAGGNWYDRILDLLLGDDETSPKNRMVLICKHCRLVNGQAPPGVKRMEELGKWRCIGCGGWNGELDEGAKIVAEIKEMEQKSLDQPESEDKHDDSAAGSDSKAPEETEADVEASEESDDEQVKEPLSKPKRGRPKGSGKSKA